MEEEDNEDEDEDGVAKEDEDEDVEEDEEDLVEEDEKDEEQDEEDEEDEEQDEEEDEEEDEDEEDEWEDEEDEEDKEADEKEQDEEEDEWEDEEDREMVFGRLVCASRFRERTRFGDAAAVVSHWELLVWRESGHFCGGLQHSPNVHCRPAQPLSSYSVQVRCSAPSALSAAAAAHVRSLLYDDSPHRGGHRSSCSVMVSCLQARMFASS